MDYKVTEDGEDIYLTPKGDHERTLVWLHGLGDSAQGFVEVFKSKKITPVDAKTKVILLTAPERPVTVNFGMTMPCWFDYKSFSISSPDEFIDLEQLKESEDRVVDVIKKEVEENLAGDYKKILIGGFSQGAALSLYVACRLQENVGAVLFCSGHPLWLNPAEDILLHGK